MQTSCLLYIGRTQTTRFNTVSTRGAACWLKGIRTWISADSFPTFAQASPRDIQPQTAWAPRSTKTLSPCMFAQAIYFFSHRKTKDLISLQSQGPKIIAKNASLASCAYPPWGCFWTWSTWVYQLLPLIFPLSTYSSIEHTAQPLISSGTVLS